MKILLVLTGGTICSFGDSKNENRDVNVTKAKRLILENFEQSDSQFSDQEFDVDCILDTLSENMTIDKWNEFIQYLKNKDFSKYIGVIIAHGTDTLAYSSAMISLALSKLDIPVFMVSSQLPLDSPKANGNDNFRTSVELIRKGIGRGVYVAYKNTDGKMYIHRAVNLRQSGDYSDDFFSRDAYLLQQWDMPHWDATKNLSSQKGSMDGAGIELSHVGQLTSDVLMIWPYVGLDYSRIPIDNSVKAVVHGLYHSSTACVEKAADGKKYPDNSIIRLIDRCRPLNIPVIVTPCRENSNAYISGADMVSHGAYPVFGMTTEMTYVKTLFAIGLGYEKDEIVRFLRTDIAGEMMY